MGGGTFAFDVYMTVPLRRGMVCTPLAAERRGIWRALHAARATRCGPLRLLALATFAHTRWEDISPHLLLEDVTWAVGVRVPRAGGGVMGIQPSKLAEVVVEVLVDLETSLASAGPALAEWIDLKALNVCAATNLVHMFHNVTDADISRHVRRRAEVDDDDDDDAAATGAAATGAAAAGAAATGAAALDDAAVDRAIFCK